MGDLRSRTKTYAANVVRLFCAMPLRRPEVLILGRQFLKAGTSVAANYREASRARSDADFISKIEVCTQEADEASLWLELLHEECGVKHDLVPILLKETDELIAIFVTMSKKVKMRRK